MIKNGPVSEIELNERREIVAALFVALWIYHFFPQFSFFVTPSLCPALFLPFLLFSSRCSRKNSFIRHHIESVVEERTFTPTNETSNDWKLATKEENIRVILTIRIETRWFQQRLGNLICRKATRPNSLPLIISLASTVHDSSLIEGYSLEKPRHTAALQSVSIDVSHLRIYYTNEYDSIEDESLFKNIFFLFVYVHMIVLVAASLDRSKLSRNEIFYVYWLFVLVFLRSWWNPSAFSLNYEYRGMWTYRVFKVRWNGKGNFIWIYICELS